MPNMTDIVRLLLTFTVIMALMHVAAGIGCYDCGHTDNVPNINCAPPFNSIGISNTTGHIYCETTKVEYGESDQTPTYDRGGDSGKFTAPYTGCKIETLFGITTTICLCDTQLCNTGNDALRFHPTWTVTMASSFIGIIFMTM